MNQVVRTTKVGGRNAAINEPIMTSENIINCLNFYRQTFDNDREMAKRWLSEFSTMFLHGFGVAELKRLGPHDFRYAMAVMARQCSLGNLPEKVGIMTYYVKMLVKKVRAELDAPKIEEPAIVRSVTDKIAAQVSRYIADLEDCVDAFIRAGYKETVEVDFFGMMQAWEIKAPQAKKIYDYYNPILIELKEAQLGKDSQLKEAYAIGVTNLKRYIAFISKIVEAANSCFRSAKAGRKPKTTTYKTKPVDFSNLNYMKVSQEYKITSVNPANIVGAQMFLTFNESNRILTVYYSKTETGLNVKSTSMYGYDEEKSFSLKLRKPDEVLPKLFNGGRKYVENTLNALRVKKQPARSVLNNNVILLRALKG